VEGVWEGVELRVGEGGITSRTSIVICGTIFTQHRAYHGLLTMQAGHVLGKALKVKFKGLDTDYTLRHNETTSSKRTVSQLGYWRRLQR